MAFRTPTRFPRVISLLRHNFLYEWWKHVFVTHLLPLSASSLQPSWNRFLRRTQTNRIKKKTFIQPSFGSPAMVFASALCSNYANEIWFNSWKHLSFLSRLTKSVNKTPSWKHSQWQRSRKNIPLKTSHVDLPGLICMGVRRTLPLAFLNIL